MTIHLQFLTHVKFTDSDPKSRFIASQVQNIPVYLPYMLVSAQTKHDV